VRRLQQERLGAAGELALVAVATKVPAEVREQFYELFREDTAAEQALGPVPYMPRSIGASARSLKFVLEHPLTLRFSRDDEASYGGGAGGRNKARSHVH
jgi:hypothetical protein